MDSKKTAPSTQPRPKSIPGINGRLIKEAIRKRTEMLEKKGFFPMTIQEFKKYFAPGKLKTQNADNCSTVSPINALRQSPNFEIIIRSSMKKLTDGSWKILIPLMSEDGKLITITPEELLPQSNPQFSMPKNGKIDLRKVLLPPVGPEGLRVLEAAFLKSKFGKVDRLKGEENSGDEIISILGGNNFTVYDISSTRKNPESGAEEHPGLDTLPPQEMSQLDDLLENFDPDIDIAVAKTKDSDNETVSIETENESWLSRLKTNLIQLVQ